MKWQRQTRKEAVFRSRAWQVHFRERVGILGPAVHEEGDGSLTAVLICKKISGQVIWPIYWLSGYICNKKSTMESG